MLSSVASRSLLIVSDSSLCFTNPLFCAQVVEKADDPPQFLSLDSFLLQIFLGDLPLLVVGTSPQIANVKVCLTIMVVGVSRAYLGQILGRVSPLLLVETALEASILRLVA